MTELWDRYNKTRLAGDKKTANKLLWEFIDLLKLEDRKFIRDFADNLCKKTLNIDGVLSNNGTEVSNNIDRIQHPLFKEIILPILGNEYLNYSSLHIRWIGQMEQFFYSDNKMTEDFLKQINLNGHFSTWHFFEKSFDIDNNQDTLKLLLQRQARDIEYYVHELPWAVLIGAEEFNTELETFRNYWSKYENKEKWRNSLTQWENIAKHWTEYLATRKEYANFMEYQERNGIELD